MIKETGSMWIREDSRVHTNSNTQILLKYSEGCQEGSPRDTGGRHLWLRGKTMKTDLSLKKWERRGMYFLIELFKNGWDGLGDAESSVIWDIQALCNHIGWILLRDSSLWSLNKVTLSYFHPQDSIILWVGNLIWSRVFLWKLHNLDSQYTLNLNLYGKEIHMNE